MRNYKNIRAFVNGKQVFCGIDVHEKHWVVCCVYEAGFSGYWLCRQLRADGYSCMVTPPSLTPQSGSKVKTDKRDAQKLAFYLSANLLKSVTVPPKDIESDLRIVRRRAQVVRNKKRAKHQILSFLKLHGFERPESIKTNWSQKHLEWLESLEFEEISDNFTFKNLLKHYYRLDKDLTEVTQYLRKLAEGPKYVKNFKLLTPLRGIGLITAMTFILEIFDFGRFQTSDQFSSYLGMTPSQYSSGEHIRLGHITRFGNAELRRVLVESAWTVIRHDPHLRNKYDRLRARGTNGKEAIVAVARSLAVRLRRCLLDQTEYVIGVSIAGSASTANKVQGNLIGTDVAGSAALGNSGFGIQIEQGASNNTVGGTSSKKRNIISGNGQRGVHLFGSNTTGNWIFGNFIGTNLNGTTDLGNGSIGVSIEEAPGNFVGGTASGAGNVISGNAGSGVFLHGSNATGNLIQGNYIGTDAKGKKALGNDQHGVDITNGASNNTVDGMSSKARNIIYSNAFSGVGIFNSGTTGNIVQGNYIGANKSGKPVLGNSQHGVQIEDDAANNTIGGTASNAGNTIAGNYQNGVHIFGNNTTGNQVRGNSIFSNDGDPSGHGEGRTYLGTASPDAQGDFAVSFANVSQGSLISATATDGCGDTSEFAAYITALNSGQQPRLILFFGFVQVKRFAINLRLPWILCIR